MNRKGNVFFGVAMGILILVFGILFLPFLTDDIDTSRTDLDCGNSNITDGAKVSCLALSGTIPYYIWFIFSIVIGFIIGIES